jgi:hypothetical protein
MKGNIHEYSIDGHRSGVDCRLFVELAIAWLQRQ